MKKKIYKISHWIHKYFGLIFLLFMAWMSISGILLNHPDLIRNVSVPNFLVPKQYQPQNWSRSSLKGMTTIGDSLLIYGRQGVFISNDKGKNIRPFMDGDFPKSAWGKRSHSLYFSAKGKVLLCANNYGIYQYSFLHKQWKHKFKDEPIIKILENRDDLLFVGKSNVFQARLFEKSIQIQKRELKRKEYKSEISLITVFFELHDGSIFGLPGKLIWDLAGLVLFFLCISAFYIWYYPKKWKRRYKKTGLRSSTKEKQAKSFFLKYHKKLGWYFGILLVLITFTGMFLTPIFMMSIARKSISEKYYPAVHHKNQWKNKIRNALYDHQNDRLVLECSDGIWAGNYQNNEVFEKIKLPVRVFGMGATLFEEEKEGSWLVGSFGGLNRIDINKNQSEKILLSKRKNHSGRPASTLVSGYQKFPDGNYYVLGHYKGVCDVNGNSQKEVMPMPAEIQNNSKLPLWNFMFELHNARMFKGLVGGFYMLIIPLGGLLCLLMLMAGILDYWLTRKKKKR